MATEQQLQAYHAQCSSIEYEAFNADRVETYRPADNDYYRDVFEHHGKAGGFAAGVCLVVFCLIFLFSLLLCCLPHRWMARMNFFGLAKNGKYWWHRVIGSVFILALVVCTILITAMSVWGIVKVEMDAKEVVPKSFDFMEDAEGQLDSIYNNLTSAVSDGNRLVDAIRNAVAEIRQDPETEALAGSDADSNQSVVQVLDELVEATDAGANALETVDEEINENLSDILDALEEAIGYRDEAEGINFAGRIAVDVAFGLFIVFGVCSVVFSLLGVSPRCILAWAVIMWLSLFVAFSLVSVADIAREVSKQTCLYIDTYAVEEIKNEVDSDPNRTERLLWYYFQAPGENKLPSDDLEDLWGLPLSDILSYFTLAESILFDGDNLRSPYDQTQNGTQTRLFEVRDLLPKARNDIDYVQRLIEGDTLNNLHKDFKDIVCCTEYEALEDVWSAWAVSSAFGLMIAVFMTLQAFFSFRCGSAAVAGNPTYVGRVQTQKTSAYMAPPVTETAYASYVEVTERGESGAPLNDAQNSSGTVAYPKLRMPPAYFEMSLRDR